MKIALIVWDEEKNRPIDLITEDALGVSFIFDGPPENAIKVDVLVKTAMLPNGGIRLRAMHGILKVMPEANNAVMIEVQP